jgi:hypothetical protein
MPNLVSRASLRPAWEVLRSPSSPSSFWEPRARRAWLAPCFVGAAVFAPGAAACVAAVVFTFSAAFFSAASFSLSCDSRVWMRCSIICMRLSSSSVEGIGSAGGAVVVSGFPGSSIACATPALAPTIAPPSMIAKHLRRRALWRTPAPTS